MYHSNSSNIISVGFLLCLTYNFSFPAINMYREIVAGIGFTVTCSFGYPLKVGSYPPDMCDRGDQCTFN